MFKKITFNHFTLLTALTISSVAIFYSVTGLTAIFAAAVIPVAIMGSSLEIGKLVVAVWLHKHWKISPWWLKTYLSLAMAVLMLITSMGIFGFLSKAHLEQAAQTSEGAAQVTRIKDEIARYQAIVDRSQSKIKDYEQNGGSVDSSIQRQIDREQSRIDSAYNRIKPQVDAQTQIINNEDQKIEALLKPYQDEINQIDVQLTTLRTAIESGQIKKAQRMIGTDDDGSYGQKTIDAMNIWKAAKEKRRKVLLWEIKNIRNKDKQNNTAIRDAQNEIQRLRNSAQTEINESNRTIKQLRAQLGATKNTDVGTLITDEQNKITDANNHLDQLTQQKYKLETAYRKLEVDVGPIKYLADFIYGDSADGSVMEKAVRWVIIMLIFVFDPLAVALLIAAQNSFDRDKKKTTDDNELDKTHNDLSKPVEDIEVDTNDTVDDLNETIIEEEPKPSLENDSQEDNKPEEPWKDLNELNQIAKEISNSQYIEHGSNQKIYLTKVGENYANFNGKVFRISALIKSLPDLNLSFSREVSFGNTFPLNSSYGDMFILTATIPTQLYIFNGTLWDKIDKNLLELTAYSKDYIQYIIKELGVGNYNPELLNEAEKNHIERLLLQQG